MEPVSNNGVARKPITQTPQGRPKMTPLAGKVVPQNTPPRTPKTPPLAGKVIPPKTKPPVRTPLSPMAGNVIRPQSKPSVLKLVGTKILQFVKNTILKGVK